MDKYHLRLLQNAAEKLRKTTISQLFHQYHYGNLTVDQKKEVRAKLRVYGVVIAGLSEVV